MICGNCGKQIESADFCPYCGVPIVPSVELVTTAEYEQPPKPKRKTWAILGICIGAAIILIAALFFILTSPVEGQWYNEERGEVIVLNADTTLQLSSIGNTLDGNFEYQRLGGKGSCDIGNISYDFSADNQQLEIDDLGVYTKCDSAFFSLNDFFFDYGSFGTWYSEDQRDVFVFNCEGKLIYHTVSGETDSNYNYDYVNQEGTLTLDTKSLTFSVADSKMTIDDIDTYTKAPDDFNIDSFLDDYRILGSWYNEQMGEVLTIEEDNVLQSQYLDVVNDASYEYDTVQKSGTVTFGTFSYNFELTGDQLDIKDRGEYTRAEKDFDTDAFLQEHGSSIYGRWYEPTGMYTIFFHPDGTYDITAFEKDFHGTHENDGDATNIEREFFDGFSIDRSYFLDSNALNECRYGDKDDIAATLERDIVPLQGKEKEFELVLGTWTFYDRILLTFETDGIVIITIDSEFSGTYDYSPFLKGGYITMYGETETFIINGNTLGYNEAVFTRVD